MFGKLKWRSILLIVVGACSCSAPSPLERALRLAGDNRPELEKVLEHYSRHDGDSLKYRAACFLIEHMPYHFTYGGPSVEAYHRAVRPLVKRGERHVIDSVKNRLKLAAERLSIDRSNIETDISRISSEYLIQHIDRIFLTRAYPWNREVSFEDFCEYVLPYRVNTEPLEDWLPIYTLASKPIADTLYEQSGSFREFIERIADFYTARSPYIRTFDFPIENYPSALLNIRYGTCHEITMWGTYIFRALGIPVCLDTTPNWTNRSKGHSWNGITIDSVYYPFIFQDYGSSGFGNHLKDRSFEKFSKIYRRTYSLPEKALPFEAGDEKLPEFFITPFLRDVTDIYADECTDVTVALKPSSKKRGVAYIMVFDNRDWTAVGWGRIERVRVRFRSVHKGSCYLAAVSGASGFVPVSDPFIVHDDGSVEPLVADRTRCQDLTLFRKYPVGSMQKFARRSVGGEFHAADRADFSDSRLLHTVGHTLDDMRWHRVAVQPSACRYLRYYSAKGGYNNMAEIVFRSADGDTLTGRIIGKGALQTDLNSRLEHALDGDPLTFFAAEHPDDSWVGLELEKPSVVARIDYIFRNDDNNIRKGDSYELFYWDNDRWNSLGTRTGTSDSLVYANCPTGALFVLRNHSRGTEERIFTYARNQPAWW